MKNKYAQKNISGYIFLWPLLIVAFFITKNSCQGAEIPLSITEIMYSPAKNELGEKTEWIEMRANEDFLFSIKPNSQIGDFYLCAKKPCSSTYALYSLEKDFSLNKDDFVIFTKDPEIFQRTYPDIPEIKIIKASSSLNLLENNDAFLAYSLDNKKTWLENISYSNFFDKKLEGYSLEKIDFKKDNTQENWQESFIKNGTPGKESSRQETREESSSEPFGDDLAEKDTPPDLSFVGKIKLNEIYPAPITKIGEREFVEIENASGESIDFSKWCLKDRLENEKAEKGACKKISEIKTAGNLVVFYGTFSLNNDSKGDSIFLYDDKNNLVDTRAYSSPKSTHSYSFDGSVWRWTSVSTPGSPNMFDPIAEIKIEKDNSIYKNIWAYFSAKVKNQTKKTKFTWNFGDSHKSYLQNTKHKYQKAGTYLGSLRVYDDKIDETLEFEIRVKKYATPKVKIVRLSPNPRGLDSKNEWIEIQNDSRKKINLLNWSIASGIKNLINHPIRKDFSIKPGKTKRLFQSICAFTLGNKTSVIELRDPSGKTIQKISYDRKNNSIQDEEVFEKAKAGWNWVALPISTDSEPTDTINSSPEITPENQPDENQLENKTSPENDFEENISQEVTIDITPEELGAALGKTSFNSVWKIENNPRLAFLSAGTNIHPSQAILENQARVLGASTVKADFSKTKTPPQSLENFWKKINSKINQLLNSL